MNYRNAFDTVPNKKLLMKFNHYDEREKLQRVLKTLKDGQGSGKWYSMPQNAMYYEYIKERKS